MAPHWIEKAKRKLGRPRQAASQESGPPPSSQSPSPTATLSVSQQQTCRPTFQLTHSAGTSTGTETVALSSLQERLWNDAYDELKSSEPKLVAAYEQILSSILGGDEIISTTREPAENVIGATRETRSLQMQQVVRKGLDRTQKQASIKQGIDEGFQVWQTLKGTVGKAVQMAPEAAVAWAGVCLGLEVCVIYFSPERVRRTVLLIHRRSSPILSPRHAKIAKALPTSCHEWNGIGN
jgi:hypothetical protein